MEESKSQGLIGIIGATATGKTRLAVALSFEINGEIISADSRQVYRGMDIGTGKDLNEFSINGEKINYHLIDIANPGEEYNVFRYKSDFDIAYSNIIKNKKNPILCGGSGLYVETALGLNNFQEVPINNQLRTDLESKSMEELVGILKNYKPLHNTTDSTDKERCIRAIEIELFKVINSPKRETNLVKDFLIFGIKYPRTILRSRITDRLNNRLQNGMIEEVSNLIKSGVSENMLKFYGLEYKYITLYIEGQMSYNEMFEKLNISIHQFAKRQETWWRRMEKKGIQINWIEGELDEKTKLDMMMEVILKNEYFQAY